MKKIFFIIVCLSGLIFADSEKMVRVPESELDGISSQRDLLQQRYRQLLEKSKEKQVSGEPQSSEPAYISDSEFLREIVNGNPENAEDLKHKVEILNATISHQARVIETQAAQIKIYTESDNATNTQGMVRGVGSIDQSQSSSKNYGGRELVEQTIIAPLPQTSSNSAPSPQQAAAVHNIEIERLEDTVSQQKNQINKMKNTYVKRIH